MKTGKAKTHKTELGRLVKVELAKLDKTQGDLAAAMKIDPSALAGWLRASPHHKAPSDLLDRVMAGMQRLTNENQKANTQ